MMGFLHGLGAPPEGLTERVLKLVFGSDNTTNASMAIRWDPPEFAVRELRQRGYRTVRQFIALPSRANPKWLLPYQDRRAASSALRTYTSYSRPLPRTAATTAAALGWPCMRGRTVLVASPHLSSFEALAQEIAGQTGLEVSISTGAPGLFRKVSALWIRRDGDAVCHMKLPMTAEANARVCHEAEILDALEWDQRLRPRIPRLIYFGTAGETPFLVQSAAEGAAGPVDFGRSHNHLLRLFRQHQPTQRPGYAVVKAVADRFRRNASHMREQWEVLGKDVLRAASQKLCGASIHCGLSHGDFTPWNTRLRDRHLSVFDWEAAEMNAPCLWDRFHFLTQTRSLLGKGDDAELRAHMPSDDHALYLLYLLDSAIKLAVEKTESNGVKYREAELLKQLRVGSQLNTAPRVNPLGSAADLDLTMYDPQLRKGPVGT